MSLRIGSGMSALYSPSRISQTSDIDNTSRIDRQSAVASEQQEGRNNAGQYVSQDHGGVVHTRIADANAFKKAQLDGSRERIESMADKLYDRLPDIFADMKNLPSETEESTAAARVSVTERNAAAIADRQAGQQDELVNFTL